jgi:hypothetical protein
MFSNALLRVSDSTLLAEPAGSGFCAAILLAVLTGYVLTHWRTPTAGFSLPDKKNQVVVTFG